MAPETRSATIAAGLILGGFGLFAFYMPAIMLAVGQYSTVAAGAIAVVFAAALFVIFWLRSLSRRGGS